MPKPFIRRIASRNRGFLFPKNVISRQTPVFDGDDLVINVFVSCRVCVDARSCVITGSKAPCCAAFLADSRAFVCVSARVCVRTIVDCGAFARVCALCHVACSCVALRLKSYASHVARIYLCRALVGVARLFKM